MKGSLSSVQGIFGMCQKSRKSSYENKVPILKYGHKMHFMTKHFVVMQFGSSEFHFNVISKVQMSSSVQF